MRKLKTAIYLLLTAALLTVHAYLPQIAASTQDASSAEPGFSDIRPVKLVFSDPEATGSLLGKLALLRDGSFYTVSPSKTNIPQSDIEQVVREGLNPYYEYELVPYNWANYEFSATPSLVYSEVDSDIYGIFWVVDMHWPDSYDSLSLYVDDETGKILYLSFNSGKALEDMTAYGYLGCLSTTYLNSTGLAEIMSDPGSWAVKDVSHDTSGLKEQNDPWVAYRLMHPDYGTLEIQFWLYEFGFYTLIC